MICCRLNVRSDIDCDIDICIIGWKYIDRFLIRIEFSIDVGAEYCFDLTGINLNAGYK